MDTEQKQEVWAQLDDKNIVVNLIVADSEAVSLLEGVYTSAGLNNELRACIGDVWNGQEFLSPKPYPSWILVDHVWVAPKPHPSVPMPMIWSEDEQDWLDNGV